MPESIANQIFAAAQALVRAVNVPGVNIAERLNSTLNQFLTWPFRAGAARIIDAEGHTATFDTVVYAISGTASEEQPATIKAGAVACAVYVVESLGPEEIRAGYEGISIIKRLKRTATPEIDYPINYTPLGIIFAIDSTISVEIIAEIMTTQNNNFPSTTWPDMVVILTKGTVNYAVQFPGEPIKGNFILPNFSSSMVPPMYVHIIAKGLGLYSMNNMCALLFPHLQVFSPGTIMPSMDAVLEGVSTLGITLGGYQFNLASELVSTPEEMYIDRGFHPPAFRIEDRKGILLSYLLFIPWQDGGVIYLIGEKLPLEGLLVFLGPVAKNAQIFKQENGAISSVLPIGQQEFGELLGRIQRQTNMNVKTEKPKGVMSKIADEGTTSPFVARLMIGLMRLRDLAFPDESSRKEFDRAYEFVVMTLLNARTTSKEIIETLAEHSRKVSRGEIALLIGEIIRINESIDNKLRKQVEEFLNSSVRVLKDGMQKLLEVLKLNIGFLYQKQISFENGIAALSTITAEFARYLQETRKWSENLISVRNTLHEGWMLPKIVYKASSGTIEVVEPQISGQSVSEFVNYMIDRLCCFVEEVSVYSLQVQMPAGLSITEIPKSERKMDCPERFQVTFVEGGRSIWTIAYHSSKFEET